MKAKIVAQPNCHLFEFSAGIWGMWRSCFRLDCSSYCFLWQNRAQVSFCSSQHGAVVVSWSPAWLMSLSPVPVSSPSLWGLYYISAASLDFPAQLPLPTILAASGGFSHKQEVIGMNRVQTWLCKGGGKKKALSLLKDLKGKWLLAVMLDSHEQQQSRGGGKCMGRQ